MIKINITAFTMLFLISCNILTSDSTVAERVKHHGYPRIGNDTQLSWEGNSDNNFLGEELFKRLHWYDYIIVDSDAVTNSVLSDYIGSSGKIRKLNPASVVTSYFSPADYVTEQGIRWRELMRTYAWGSSYDYTTGTDSNLSDGFNEDEWLFYTNTGNAVRLFDFGDGVWSLLQNPGNSDMRSHFITTYNSVIVSRNLVDGIYHDWAVATTPFFPSVPDGFKSTQIDLDRNGSIDVINLSDLDDPVNLIWRNGLKDLYSQSRNTYPANFLLTGNCGWFSEPVYADILQGVQLEDFNNAVDSTYGWDGVMYTYASYDQNGQEPKLNIVQALLHLPDETNSWGEEYRIHDKMAKNNNLWFTAADMQELRFTLASTLMFDGYFTISHHNDTGGGYTAAWWMDEFSVNKISGKSYYPNDSKAFIPLSYKGWMGLPITTAVKADNNSISLWSVLQNGKDNGADNSVWIRTFENAFVIVNPTVNQAIINLPEGNYKRIQGILAPDINNGQQVVSTVIVPARDGLILIKY